MIKIVIRSSISSTHSTFVAYIDPHSRFFSLVNEAARDDSDVLLVIVMCILFCFAVRHANDFYAGETVRVDLGRRDSSSIFNNLEVFR